MYSMIMLKNKFISFLLFAIVTYSASFIGSIATISYKEPWYSSLNKSFLTPPDWVFAPVWVSLYLLIGYATWLMWSTKQNTQKILNIYFIHLVVNASWSITFFAFHQILASLIIVGVIILFTVFLIKLYYQINKTSAFLMLPYFAWLCFAFVLNYSIFTLN